MKKITVVIGHRLGKGQQIAEGIRQAGGEPILIPGMGADMKLGDVMHEHDADLGLSFCGSGGAGAITANSSYGYPMEYGMRSVDAGVTAVENGARVVGFGFMDSEELGRRMTEAYAKAHRDA